jgi:hypothetical protein
MTRPDWCLQDVWETAGLWLVGRAHCEPSAREWVARAILAERERAAEVCRSEAKGAKAKLLIHEALGALWCAKSIMKGTP